MSRFAQSGLAGLAFAVLLNVTVTIEWTTPYCLTQGDGPGIAAYGFPLPYTRWCGYTSLRYAIVPILLAFDLGATAVVGAALAHRCLKRLSPRWVRFTRSVAWLVLGFWLTAQSVTLAMGWNVLEASLKPYGETYADYRPVAVLFRPLQPFHYHCTPAPW